MNVLAAAAAFLTSLGAPTPAVPLQVGNATAVCNYPAAACAYPDRVVFGWDLAADARAFDRATSAADRRRAFARCATACDAAMASALHELVHVDRYRYLGSGDPYAGQSWFEEGLAQAVAVDQTCPMEKWLTGTHTRGCRMVGGAYPGWTARVRMVSAAVTGAAWCSPAARKWRLREVVA